MAYGNSNSAGVAILKGSFQGKILKTVAHDSGRWIILVCEFMDDIFILGNIYGYNNSLRNTILFEEFENEIYTLLNTFINAKLLFGGDWNSISNPTKDCHPQRSLKGTYGEFNNLCLHLNCCDIWRVNNPDQIQFTWNNKDLSIRSRIDFWLISNELKGKVKEVKIQPSIFTDHKLIFLTLHTKNQLIRYNPNFWKLNNTLLCDKSFKEKAKEIINENWRKAQEEKMYGQHWEYAKFQIRNMAIKRGKELAKEKRFEQDRILNNIISIYEKDNMSQTDINKLTELQSELENVYQYLARGAFIRSRRR